MVDLGLAIGLVGLLLMLAALGMASPAGEGRPTWKLRRWKPIWTREVRETMTPLGYRTAIAGIVLLAVGVFLRVLARTG